VNIDDHNGVPSQPVKRPPPPHWRLDAIAAVGRPHDMVLSNDSTEIAFVLDFGDASDIWAMRVDGHDIRRLTTDRAPHAYWEDTPPAWSPDGRLVAYANDGSVHVTPAAGGPSRRLVTGGSPTWLDDEHLLISVERDRVTRLCHVALDDPWPAPLTPADGSASAVSLAPDRRRVAYVHAPRDDRRRSDLRIVDVATGELSTVVSPPGIFVGSPAFSPDGRSIVFASEHSGWRELHVFGDGNERRLTSAQADFSSPRWSADGRQILAVRVRAGAGDLVLVDAGDGTVTAIARGGTWSDPRWVADRSVVALFEDQRNPPQIVAVAPDGRIERRFAQIPAAIATASHVVAEVVSYPSHDGVEIPGRLLRPPNAKGPCPVVVYPHGGPTAHYGDEWDGHAQYFIDKGYGWFAIDFRGSTSYGLDFEHANHGVWGVADTGDCLAAYDYLAGLDWVDPDRIAIFGASYGAYLAVAALARDPRHRFAAGIAKFGDSDILTSWAQGDQVGVDDLERMMGHPSEDRAGYREGSPVHWVSNIERPLLVVHGELDERVSPKQSKQLTDALRAHGKTFEYITYPTEGHGLLRRGPQIHFYQRLERFLDWYLM
jgi:dipeptidyl aminopeptidase/acylaminoacyl peptidase